MTTVGAPLRIVIADDQASVREGLVLLLGGLPGIDVVGAAADGEQALALVAEHHPDAILLDLHMPVLDGIETTRRLTAEHPDVAVVILTTYADDESVLDACGPAPAATSPRTPTAPTSPARSRRPRAACRCSTPACRPPSSPRLLRPPRRLRLRRRGIPGLPPPPDGLTQREAEILALIAQGLTNPEIAARLFLSNHTVKTHISRIFAKTGSRDRVAAIGYARRHNIG